MIDLCGKKKIIFISTKKNESTKRIHIWQFKNVIKFYLEISVILPISIALFYLLFYQNKQKKNTK